MAINSFKDLQVWQAAVELATRIYVVTKSLPAEERYGLTAQARRAATSVAANIAEGHARNGTREFLHFLSVTLGSLAELKTHLEIAVRAQLLSVSSIDDLPAAIARLRGQLLTLCISLRRRVRGVSDDVAGYGSLQDPDVDPEHREIGPLPLAPCPDPLIDVSINDAAVRSHPEAPQ